MAIELRKRKAWTVATSERKRDVAIRPQTTAHQSLQKVTGLDGDWNCCDFWIDVQYDDDSAPGTVAGWSTVILSLWAKNGFVETMLDSKLVSDHEGILLPQRSSRRRAQSILLSARGRPCDGFFVRAQPYENLAAPLVEYARAKTVLECWGEDSTNPNDGQGRTIIDPFAGRHQVMMQSTLLIAGDNNILDRAARPGYSPFPDDDRRLFITHISIYTNDQLREVRLVSIDPGAIRTNVFLATASPEAPLVHEYTYALRGQPGGQWLLNMGVVANLWWCNAVGYIE